MGYTYIYEAATGRLESSTEDGGPVAPDDVLAAKGLLKICGLPALDATHAWDASSRTVIEVSAPILPNIVTTADWVMQFTPAEFAGIRASADPAVQHFLFALTMAQTINLNNPSISNGLLYLVSLGLLTQARATALQTWTEGA